MHPEEVRRIFIVISDTNSDILSDMSLMCVPVKHEGETIVFK